MIPADICPENSENLSASVELRYVVQENDVRACYPLIRQLHPHLDSEQALLLRWQHQSTQGYRQGLLATALRFSITLS